MHAERDDHFVQIYEADDVLVRGVAEYVIHGIKAGETCIVVATPEHREGINQLVAQHAATLGTHAEYIELDARETVSKFSREGLDRAGFDEVIGGLIRNAAKSGPIRVYGEMVALLLADGRPKDALKLEHFWNELRDELSFTLFCAYWAHEVTRSGDADFMEGVCNAHSRVIPHETYTSLAAEERIKKIACLLQRNLQLEAELAAFGERRTRN
jgi:hypothetical protein